MIPARGGLHFVEWGCELAGTALLLLGGLSAVTFDFMPGSPLAAALPSMSVRLLITGALFAASGSLVAISPLGRRSGAHLNPAVTLAFWITRHVHRDDLFGYIGAQLAGGLAGFGLVWLLWRDHLAAVHYTRTAPGRGLSAPEAALVEAVMVAALVALIFACVARRALAHWTPLGTWVVVTVLVWQCAPYTGTSLNPVRSLGPALAAGAMGGFWVYVVGPLAGATMVALGSRLLGAELLTAKLFHDPRYPSALRHSEQIARVTRPRSA